MATAILGTCRDWLSVGGSGGGATVPVVAAASSRERRCGSFADGPCRRRQLLGHARPARGRRRSGGLRGHPGDGQLSGVHPHEGRLAASADGAI